jgi:uncharacterized protein involved in exopolysaccharide biosynthesis
MDHVQLQPAPVSYPPATSDDVDFTRFVRRVVVDRKKLLLAAIAGAVLALPFDLLRPDMYLAEVVLMAVDPLIEGGNQGTGDNPYRALIANRTLSRDVLKEYKLSEPPASMTADEFIDDHLEVSTVRGSSLIVARFRWTDPEVAAGVLNTLSEKAVNLNRKLNADETTWVRDQMGEKAVSNVARLHVVDTAQVPEDPVRAYRGLYVALGAIVALLLCFVYLILKEVGRAAMGLPVPS